MSSDEGNNDGEIGGPQSLRSMRRRNRAVAEREASRLARPEQRSGSAVLGHASRSKSAVTSTPFGWMMKSKTNIASATGDEEWCGPFSVARQMIAAREDAKKKREEEQKEREEEENGGGERHPLDEIMTEVDMEKKRKANPSMTWKS